MSLLNRSQLKYSYHWWPIPDSDPRVSDVFDTTLLNRNEGHEVLFFINKFAEIHSLTNIEDGLKIEELIKTEVPNIYRSQIHAYEWLEENIGKILKIIQT
jgi:hypothetical protein